MRTVKKKLGHSRHNVTVQLAGGIGNQLFQYYAGYVIASQSGRELILDDFRTREGSHYINRVNSKMPISGMRGLIGFNERYLSNTPFNRILARNKIATKLPVYKRRIAVIDFSSDGERGTNLTAQDIDISYRHEKTLRVRGDLQSKQIVNTAFQLGANSTLSVRELSNVAIHYVDLVKTLKPIGIHLRLFDLGVKFAKLPLGLSYYQESINSIKSKFPDSPIWLFTDDIELAKTLLPPNFFKEISLIVDPCAISDVETLLIMSMCEGLVLTNSTFSFWAGVFSKSKLVITPPEFLWS